jgi:hypothetical protein
MTKRVLFYDTSRFNARNAPRVLAVCDCQTIVAKTEEEFKNFLTTEAFDLLIYPVTTHKMVEQVHVKVKSSIIPTPVILLSQSKIKDLTPFFQKGRTTNILAKNHDGRIKPRDLITTVNKIFDENIFGVQHYVNYGTKSEVYHIRDSEERRDYIEAVTDFCRRMHVRTATIQAVELFCEELLMNAIYDAPRDDKGQELYGHISRQDRVILKPQEAARMEFACDGEKLAISVSDPFGAITWDTVQRYLAKCFSGQRRITNIDQDGGAGLGLYFCFSAVNSFIINVNPQVRSEFIGIFDLDLTPKERHSQYSSLHFFSTDSNNAENLKKKLLPVWQAS